MIDFSICESFKDREIMNKKRYDYLIVGAGLWGATFAYLANKRSLKVLMVEQKSQVAGHIYTENVEGIEVHKYGPHIFHTDNQRVWDFVNSLVEMNNFINTPLANYKGEIYNLPFNMNTFEQMWGVKDPDLAKKIIAKQRCEIHGEPKNLAEQAISLVGRDIYEKLIKEYTEKQWGRSCEELPAFIIRRLPVRFVYNNNYYNSKYQGIPTKGYTHLIETLLEGVDLKLNCNFLDEREQLLPLADKVIYTGPIDAYYDYKFGALEYRSLEFKQELLEIDDFQANAVVNYTSHDQEYTRITEHKHFNPEKKVKGKTIISYEYPKEWKIGDEAYYPVNDEKNQALLKQYQELAQVEENVIFAGRLGNYKYYDMDDTIASVFEVTDKLFEKK